MIEYYSMYYFDFDSVLSVDDRLVFCFEQFYQNLYQDEHRINCHKNIRHLRVIHVMQPLWNICEINIDVSIMNIPFRQQFDDNFHLEI